MIVNPSKSLLDKAYKCNEGVKDYLVREHGLPILCIVGNYFYFTDNAKLRKALSEMPLRLRISSWFK